MKIEVLKENLKNGLSVVEKITGKNLSLPILDNVLISTEENFLNLSSTDLETAIRLWMLVKIVKKGKVSVPARFFSSLVSSLPNEKITLEEKNQGLAVECKSFKNQIQGLNPEEFPIIPDFKNESFVEVDIKKISQGLSQVADIPSPSQSRPEISGIFFSFSKNTLKIAATDSFRLAEKTIMLDSVPDGKNSFIMPQKPAKELINILQDKDSSLKLYSSSNQVMFEVPMKEASHPQVQLISRVIEGEYPNYGEIIPKSFKTKVILKRDELLSQIKTASLFSGKINEVRIKADVSAGEVQISSQDSSLGQNQSSMQAKIDGETIEAAFNHKFLTDGLANIKSSEVSVEFSKEDGPCVIRPVGDASYIYVVMPIKSA